MVEANLESKFVMRRKELKLTQKDISDAVGISVRSISHWEQGTHVPRLTPRQFSILCKVLQCTIHDLASDFELIAAKS
ncbi:MAG: helix-turn-helix transcriptional regulator [Cyanobacteria bacterium J06560_5]